MAGEDTCQGEWAKTSWVCTYRIFHQAEMMTWTSAVYGNTLIQVT